MVCTSTTRTLQNFTHPHTHCECSFNYKITDQLSFKHLKAIFQHFKRTLIKVSLGKKTKKKKKRTHHNGHLCEMRCPPDMDRGDQFNLVHFFASPGIRFLPAFHRINVCMQLPYASKSRLGPWFIFHTINLSPKAEAEDVRKHLQSHFFPSPCIALHIHPAPRTVLGRT